MEKGVIKIGVFGAAGRMGQALIRCAGRFSTLSLACAIESEQSSALGKDAGIVAGSGPSGVIISSDAKRGAESADVLIDFSSSQATAQHAVIAAEMKKGMVIGVTGLDKEQTKCLKKAAETIPIVWAPNMSMGVNLLFNLTEKAAGVLREYDIEIIEIHHKHKKDAPSGTALRLAESAAGARKLDPGTAMAHGRHGLTGERPVDQIGMHAVRSGDVVGEHTVILASDGERIELTHRASSRDCFAMGALRASVWVAGRNPGLYNMQDVLELGG